MFLTIAHINLGVTTNLRNKGLSVSQVEDWKVTIPSFDLFPTMPHTFDEVYWETYWGIVNKPAFVVRDVMIKLGRKRNTREGEDGYEQTETRTRCAETTREACTEEEKKNH